MTARSSPPATRPTHDAVAASTRRTGEIRTRRVDPDADLHVTGGGEPRLRHQVRVPSPPAATPATNGSSSASPTPPPRAAAERPAPPSRRSTGSSPSSPAPRPSSTTAPSAAPTCTTSSSRHGDHPDRPGPQSRRRRRTRPPPPRATRNGTVPSTTRPRSTSSTAHPTSGTLAVDGTPILHPLTRTKLVRRRDKDGWRLYGEYRLPDAPRWRHHPAPTRPDRRGRPRPGSTARNTSAPSHPTTPTTTSLYGRRNDTESGNRLLDDSMLRERAHTVGRRRQLLNLITWAALRNASAVHQHAPTRAPATHPPSPPDPPRPPRPAATARPRHPKRNPTRAQRRSRAGSRSARHHPDTLTQHGTAASCLPRTPPLPPE